MTVGRDGEANGDSPERFVMSWLGTPEPTEVEFEFRAIGADRTRVTVEHRGWEGLTEIQLSEHSALPGGYTGGAYGEGWARILAHMVPAVELEPASIRGSEHTDSHDHVQQRHTGPRHA